MQAACRWTDADLKAWIDDPGRVRPGTAMPPFNRLLPAEDCQSTARIVRDLDALKTDDVAACANRIPRP